MPAASAGLISVRQIWDDIFGDIFGDLFGGGTETQQQPTTDRCRAPMSRINVRISFMEAVFGVTKKFEMNMKEECPTMSW